MKNLRLAIGLLAVTAVFNSCIKSKFDTPLTTDQVDPHLQVNMSIAQLSSIALSMPPGGYRTMGDSTIYGIVTADDRSGNFYKQIIIQDSTGGIAITIAQTNLYNDFAIGRKVYIKLNGLTIVNYKGLPEVVYSVNTGGGALTTNGIPVSFIPTTIIKASFPHTVTPLKVRLFDVAASPASYMNLLVEFENMEFQGTSAGQPYAAPSLIAISTARYIEDCPTTASLEVYNSGYANFQPYTIPSGKGTITGIYSWYGSSPQFLIRDTTDVQMTQPRDCP